MKNGWLIAGAVFGCSAGVGLVACGSSTTSTTGTTGTTTHSTSAGTTSTSGSTGSGGATTTTGTATGGGTTSTTGTATGGSTTTTECGTVSKLHPPNLDAGPGTIYCPFSAVGDGGEEYCTPGTQHCCETPEGNATPSACVTTTACPNQGTTGYMDWGCQDPVADCTTTAPVCCAQGATLVLGVPQGAMQCGNYASEMKTSACVASAAACTGIILCTSNAECPTAKPTCTPFEKAGGQVGGCM